MSGADVHVAILTFIVARELRVKISRSDRAPPIVFQMTIVFSVAPKWESKLRQTSHRDQANERRHKFTSLKSARICREILRVRRLALSVSNASLR
jgi:hypothetical protein